jgi:hypothetical protein
MAWSPEFVARLNPDKMSNYKDHQIESKIMIDFSVCKTL